ncbi:MAG: hypothetical protein ACREBF_03220 [Candidatus Micrarchaeales archaeon]
MHNNFKHADKNHKISNGFAYELRDGSTKLKSLLDNGKVWKIEGLMEGSKESPDGLFKIDLYKMSRANESRYLVATESFIDFDERHFSSDGIMESLSAATRILDDRVEHEMRKMGCQDSEIKVYREICIRANMASR